LLFDAWPVPQQNRPKTGPIPLLVSFEGLFQQAAD
jgi:hypothetical protein